MPTVTIQNPPGNGYAYNLNAVSGVYDPQGVVSIQVFVQDQNNPTTYTFSATVDNARQTWSADTSNGPMRGHIYTVIAVMTINNTTATDSKINITKV